MSEPDRRYRVLVNLVRSDRPRYWTWHCPNCQRPIMEIVNAEPVSTSDLIDMSSLDKILIGRRCDGRSPTGIGRCDFWWYFNLADKPGRKA